MLVKKVQRYWRARRSGTNPFKGAMFKKSKSGLYGQAETIELNEKVDCFTCKNQRATF